VPEDPRVNVLLVEDETRIAAFVRAGFQERGIVHEHCRDGRLGLERALQGGHDAIVLDIMLPGRDGLSILRDLRAAGRSTPVLLLTARNELEDRLEGLRSGADDYLAKPFFVEELVARLEALLRRASGLSRNLLEVDRLKLDRLSREAAWCDRSVEFTSREFSLLEYLMRSPGHVFTRTQILEHVWGYDFDPTTNVVDVCIRRIRRKLEGAQAQEESPIESVRGVGYRFRKPA